MPELHITESQKRRFDALREELEAEHAGPYASVRQQDVVDYLLDLAEEVDDPAGSLEMPPDASAGSTDTAPGDEREPADDSADSGTRATSQSATTESDTSGEATETVTTEDSTSAGPTGGPGGMLNLLERHDDKWREGSGEERYEVELDDGTVETARTKDDVKAILFKHY